MHATYAFHASLHLCLYTLVPPVCACKKLHYLSLIHACCNLLSAMSMTACEDLSKLDTCIKWVTSHHMHCRAIITAHSCLLFEPSNNQSKKFLECVTPRLTANEGARVLAEFRRNHDDYAEGENEQPPFELEMVEGALMVATGIPPLILFAQLSLPSGAQPSVGQLPLFTRCILPLNVNSTQAACKQNSNSLQSSLHAKSQGTICM